MSGIPLRERMIHDSEFASEFGGSRGEVRKFYSLLDLSYLAVQFMRLIQTSVYRRMMSDEDNAVSSELHPIHHL